MVMLSHLELGPEQVLEELEKRLIQRGTEPKEKVVQRLETAKREIARFRLYDYVVTNHVVEETVDTLQAILQVERFRSTRYRPASADIQALLKNQVTV